MSDLDAWVSDTAEMTTTLTAYLLAHGSAGREAVMLTVQDLTRTLNLHPTPRPSADWLTLPPEAIEKAFHYFSDETIQPLLDVLNNEKDRDQ